MSGGTRRIRVATYNVHRCIGGDRRHDPERIAEVLRELDADLVALQEVTKRAGAPGDLDQLEVLAAATGLSAIPGPTLLTERGHQGNAILTRLPVDDVRVLDLSCRGCEPRGALDVEVRVGAARRLRVLATHLGLRPRERRLQLETLRSMLASGDAEPALVLGDLNEWYRPERVSRRLGGGFGSRSVATYPARWPMLALDRIFARPAASLVDVRAHLTPASRWASDHLPLQADLALAGA